MNGKAIRMATLLGLWACAAVAQDDARKGMNAAERAGPAPVAQAERRPVNAAPAFGTVAAVERVRIAEPLQFVVGGSPRRESELLMITIDVRDPASLLPQSRPDDAYVVGGMKARVVAYPVFDRRLVLLVPAATPSPAASVWIAPGDPGIEKLQAGEVESLRERHARAAPANAIALPASAASLRAKPATHTYSTLDELRRAIAPSKKAAR